MRLPPRSRTFDWHATSFLLAVTNFSTVAILINATGSARTRLECTHGSTVTTVWVDAGSNGAPQEVATGTPPNADTVMCYNSLEPRLALASSSATKDTFTFLGYSTDAAEWSAPPPLARRLEFVGDSITAGAGSLGSSSTPGCNGDAAHSSNWASWGRYVCTALQADCVSIAVSGRGVYENFRNTPLERMPEYFAQTLYGVRSADWDFSRFAPDAVIINLGNSTIHDGREGRRRTGATHGGAGLVK